MKPHLRPLRSKCEAEQQHAVPVLVEALEVRAKCSELQLRVASLATGFWL